MPEEGSSTEWKTWQVYYSGKIQVLMLDLNESREGLCRRGCERSFHVDGPKTKSRRNIESEVTTRAWYEGQQKHTIIVVVVCFALFAFLFVCLFLCFIIIVCNGG